MKAVLGGMRQVEAVRAFEVSQVTIGRGKALQARPRGRRKAEGRFKGW